MNRRAEKSTCTCGCVGTDSEQKRINLLTTGSTMLTQMRTGRHFINRTRKLGGGEHVDEHASWHARDHTIFLRHAKNFYCSDSDRASIISCWPVHGRCTMEGSLHQMHMLCTDEQLDWSTPEHVTAIPAAVGGDMQRPCIKLSYALLNTTISLKARHKPSYFEPKMNIAWLTIF